MAEIFDLRKQTKDWLNKLLVPKDVSVEGVLDTGLGQAALAGLIVQNPAIVPAASAINAGLKTKAGKEVQQILDATPPGVDDIFTAGARKIPAVVSKMGDTLGPTVGRMMGLMAPAVTAKYWEDMLKGKDYGGPGGSELETLFKELKKSSLLNKDVAEQGALSGRAAVEHAITDPNVNVTTWEELKKIARDGFNSVSRGMEHKRMQGDNTYKMARGTGDVIANTPANTLNPEELQIAEQTVVDPNTLKQIESADGVHSLFTNPKLSVLADYMGVPKTKTHVQQLRDMGRQRQIEIPYSTARRLAKNTSMDTAFPEIVKASKTGLDTLTSTELSTRISSLKQAISKPTRRFSPTFDVRTVLDELSKTLPPKEIRALQRVLGGSSPNSGAELLMDYTKRKDPEAKRQSLLKLNEIFDNMYSILSKQNKIE